MLPAEVASVPDVRTSLPPLLQFPGFVPEDPAAHLLVEMVQQLQPDASFSGARGALRSTLGLPSSSSRHHASAAQTGQASAALPLAEIPGGPGSTRIVDISPGHNRRSLAFDGSGAPGSNGMRTTLVITQRAQWAVANTNSSAGNSTSETHAGNVTALGHGTTAGNGTAESPASNGAAANDTAEVLQEQYAVVNGTAEEVQDMPLYFDVDIAEPDSRVPFQVRQGCESVHVRTHSMPYFTLQRATTNVWINAPVARVSLSVSS